MTSVALDRRALIAAAFASLASPVSAADLEKIRVSIIPVNDVTPLFVAVQKGFFADEGLLVDTTPTTGGATGIPGLIAGSFDLMYGNVVSTLLAVQQGLDLKVVGAGTAASTADADNSQLIVRSESGLRTGKDLEGKRLATNTRNNVLWLYARAWIKKTGGDPDRVIFREVPFPQMEDALRQKQIDCCYIIAPFSVAALDKAEFTSIGKPYSEVQPRVNVGQYLSTGSFYASRTATVEKFARGLRRGAEWYNANLDSPDLLKTIADFTRIDVLLLQRMKLNPAPLLIDKEQIDTTMRLMIDNKILKGPLDLSSIIAPTAL